MLPIRGILAGMPFGRKVGDKPASRSADPRLIDRQPTSQKCPQAVGRRAAIGVVTDASRRIRTCLARLVANRVAMKKEETTIIKSRIVGRLIVRPILAALNEHQCLLNRRVVS